MCMKHRIGRNRAVGTLRVVAIVLGIMTLKLAAAEPPSGIKAFDAWLQSNKLAENARISTTALARGVEAAQARRADMKALIQNDPARAIDYRLTRRQRSELPTKVRDSLEQEVLGTGFFGVLAICAHGDETAENGFRREVMLGETYYIAHIYGKGLDRLTEKNATIYGVAVDGHIALHEDTSLFFPAESLAENDPCGELGAVLRDGALKPVDSEDDLAAGETPAPRSVTAKGSSGNVFDPANPPSSDTPPTEIYDKYTGTGSWKLGPKTVMVILVEPSDGEEWTDPKSFEELAAELDEASQWYYDCSYRQTWFGPKRINIGESDEMDIDRLVVTPVVLRLSRTKDEYKSNFVLLRMDSIAAARELGGEWDGGTRDPYNFDRIVAMSNTKLINASGLAYVGGTFAWVGSKLKGSVAIHEWGHNWGVVHANLWTSNDGITRSDDGKHKEYGDKADVMGNGGTNEFNPLFKERLNFLTVDAGEIIEVDTSGTYRVFDHVDPHSETPATKVRALKLAITGYSSSDQYIMLGLRHVDGNDGGTSRKDWNRNALEMHADGTSPSSGDNDGSHFLDSTPGSTDKDSDDGGILIGTTYSEGPEVNGTNINGELHVTPIARGSIEEAGHVHEYMDVVINIGDFSGNQAPTASIVLSNPEPEPGDLITLTANASDPDGDTLAYAWKFGDGKYSLDNVSSVEHAWSAEGTHEVTLRVSDMKGKTYETTATVDVGGNESGTISLAVAAVAVDEDAGTVSVDVTRADGVEGEVNVDYTTDDDTAEAGNDYTQNNGTLTWAAGNSDTQTITVDITDDADKEGDETFTIKLSNPTNGAAIGTSTTTVTINTNDQYGTITLPVTADDVNEGDSITVVVQRNGGSDGEVSVVYETAQISGGATSGDDYTAQTDTLTWADGNNADKNIVIDIVDDTDAESNEDFQVKLLSPNGGATIGNDTETITIHANDAPGGILSLTATTASVDEDAGSITLFVSRSDGATGTVTVDYSTSDNGATAGNDYVAANGTLSWDNGDSADKDITITISDDADFEGDEAFELSLSNVTGDAVLAGNSATITIVENESGNNDPVITDGPNADPASVTLPNTIALGVTASDADGDTLTYAWSKESGPGGVSFSTQDANTVASFDAAGSYTLKVTVNDGAGGSVSGTVDVTILAGSTGAALSPADDGDDGCSIGFGGSALLPLLLLIAAMIGVRFKTCYQSL